MYTSIPGSSPGLSCHGCLSFSPFSRCFPTIPGCLPTAVFIEDVPRFTAVWEPSSRRVTRVRDPFRPRRRAPLPPPARKDHVTWNPNPVRVISFTFTWSFSLFAHQARFFRALTLFIWSLGRFHTLSPQGTPSRLPVPGLILSCRLKVTQRIFALGRPGRPLLRTCANAAVETLALFVPLMATSIPFERGKPCAPFCTLARSTLTSLSLESEPRSPRSPAIRFAPAGP